MLSKNWLTTALIAAILVTALAATSMAAAFVAWKVTDISSDNVLMA